MGLSDWIADSRRYIHADGLREGLRKTAQDFSIGALRRAGNHYDYGTYVFEEDWDLLVILDACRADLMREVADEYPFLSYGSTYSCAGYSGEWLEKNMQDAYAEEIAETAYVTGNPFSARVLPDGESRFAVFDEVWTYSWDEEIGTIRPESVTDRAVHHARNSEWDRMIVHYMQPHFPFIESPVTGGLAIDDFSDGTSRTPWELLCDGEITREAVWNAYRENLQIVLEQVEVLLENVDAPKTIISADHGNALGEGNLYGHSGYIPHPALIKVPWCEATATDDEAFEPGLTSPVEPEPAKDRLQDLGYL